ncbi:hypothetical protein [Lelliottia amnigena]|jgi:hypothetical protein|uniref:hypothetical protein n=1 Tax=Lelliottia amnigena TaxID=61646 RepID=UPI00192A8885|nr:hypothetical protein [Lelliottia amnigena]MBL5930781.1 hypothetical protein [Lelliottia amnigena]MCE9967210.1 hypothetical protein [Lelliottia amnigena]QXZ20486.1 hypothetical protein I6L75_04860 [Lelliottia amnigena]
MTRKTNTRVVLVTREQYAALERIQQRDSQISTTGAAPTINAIARILLEKALSETNQEKTA